LAVATKFDSVPFWTVTSLAVKPVTASLKVKVTVAVSPEISALSDSVMATVGRVAAKVSVPLLASAPVLPVTAVVPPLKDVSWKVKPLLLDDVDG
jgi:hypothetical protein